MFEAFLQPENVIPGQACAKEGNHTWSGEKDSMILGVWYEKCTKCGGSKPFLS